MTAITAFYKFIDLPEEELETIQQELLQFGQDTELCGLTLLAHEGINGTIAGPKAAIEAWEAELTRRFGEITFKRSQADTQPFKRWFVKIRQTIVNLGQPVSPNGKHNHISPEEWDNMLQQDDVVVIDTRNDYEVAIGKFEGAIDPNIKTFQEFPEYVKNANIPKDKKVLMYCTGGIRCEKAIFEMEKQGYEHVYQLDGGILRYLQERPEGTFKGECFVFDHRVAVNKDLKPSEQYALCPHTGDPADTKISCKFCGETAKVHNSCVSVPELNSCSKNCAHHLKIGSKHRNSRMPV